MPDLTDPTPLDLDELERAVDRSECTDANQWAYTDVVTYLTPAKLRALIAELRSLRAAGEWIACLDRMPKPGDSVVARGIDMGPMAGKVEGHWRTANGLLLDTPTGEGYGFEWFTHWMPLPSPPVVKP